jgi:hypothetical protein
MKIDIKETLTIKQEEFLQKIIRRILRIYLDKKLFVICKIHFNKGDFGHYEERKGYTIDEL